MDEVIAKELSLLRPDIRANAATFSGLLHDDFREFGASGRVWDHARALEAADRAVLVLERDRLPIGLAEVTGGGDLPPLGVIVRTAMYAFGILGSVRAAWKSWLSR